MVLGMGEVEGIQRKAPHLLICYLLGGFATTFPCQASPVGTRADINNLDRALPGYRVSIFHVCGISVDAGGHRATGGILQAPSCILQK